MVEHVRRLRGQRGLGAGDGGKRRLDRLLAEFFAQRSTPSPTSFAV